MSAVLTSEQGFDADWVVRQWHYSILPCINHGYFFFDETSIAVFCSMTKRCQAPLSSDFSDFCQGKTRYLYARDPGALCVRFRPRVYLSETDAVNSLTSET